MKKQVIERFQIETFVVFWKALNVFFCSFHHFPFLPKMYNMPAKELRIEHRFRFIARTFTILFAVCFGLQFYKGSHCTGGTCFVFPFAT